MDPRSNTVDFVELGMTTVRRRILVVEDDTSIAKLVTTSPERAGFALRVAGDVDRVRSFWDADHHS